MAAATYNGVTAKITALETHCYKYSTEQVVSWLENCSRVRKLILSLIIFKHQNWYSTIQKYHFKGYNERSKKSLYRGKVGAIA